MMGIGPLFKGVRFVTTEHSARELYALGLDEWEAVEVLTNGWDCSRSKRKKGKIERCLERGRKVIRAVAVSGVYSIEGQIEEAYYLVHISIETINKVRKRRVGD